MHVSQFFICKFTNLDMLTGADSTIVMCERTGHESSKIRAGSHRGKANVKPSCVNLVAFDAMNEF